MNKYLNIDTQLTLAPVHPSFSEELYQLSATNREHLSEWLPWPDYMQSADFISNFINGSLERNAAGAEQAFVILLEGKICGRIGLYKIDTFNQSAEIGYWLGSGYQGQGIITRSCRELIRYAFEQLQLNRIEIRCAVGNDKSQAIPQRLGFTEEGILRDAEWLRDHFNDLKVYSLLLSEYTIST